MRTLNFRNCLHDAASDRQTEWRPTNHRICSSAGSKPGFSSEKNLRSFAMLHTVNRTCIRFALTFCSLFFLVFLTLLVTVLSRLAFLFITSSNLCIFMSHQVFVTSDKRPLVITRYDFARTVPSFMQVVNYSCYFGLRCEQNIIATIFPATYFALQVHKCLL